MRVTTKSGLFVAIATFAAFIAVTSPRIALAKQKKCPILWTQLELPFPGEVPLRLPSFTFLDSITLSEKNLDRLYKKARGLKIPVKPPKDKTRWVEFLNAVTTAIEKMPGTDLEKGNLMAKFGEAIEPTLRKLPKEKALSMEFSLARQVLRLESWKVRELRIAAKELPYVPAGVNPVEIRHFYNVTTSYIRNSELYRILDDGNRGAINVNVLRDIQANNRWPVYMKPHDARHIHFAVGHPRAGGVFFESARSKNGLRFSMLSAIFEGVDTAQYSRETEICRYFRDKMKMRLEDAMIYIGRAPQKELERILSELNESEATELRNIGKEFDKWIPKIGAVEPEGWAAERSKEIDQWTEEMWSFRNDESKKKFLRYRQEPSRKGVTRDESHIRVRND